VNRSTDRSSTCRWTQSCGCSRHVCTTQESTCWDQQRVV
jgi:hypothetical protein